MSAIEMMSSAPKFSYQRLRNEGGVDDDDDYEGRADRVVIGGRARSWSRFRKVPIRKRFKLRIPGLRRFLRRKAKLVSAVRVSWTKVMKRLKESQSHFGDLFAGNYMLMQVNPTQFKCIEKSFNKKSHQDLHNHHGLSSRYSLPNKVV